jgi:hypothetical protein
MVILAVSPDLRRRGMRIQYRYLPLVLLDEQKEYITSSERPPLGSVRKRLQRTNLEKTRLSNALHLACLQHYIYADETEQYRLIQFQVAHSVDSIRPEYG